MANFKNTNYDYYSGVKDTAPKSSIKTGTIETDGANLVGTGTLFLSELPIGSWVCDLANDEIRKVVRVDSDVKALLSNPFTVNIAPATALQAVSAIDAQCVSVSVQIPSGAANGIVDGKVFPAGTSVTFAKDGRDNSGNFDHIDPIIVDATATTAQVMCLK